MIELNNICKTYVNSVSTSQMVLEHVNLQINSGEMLSFVGPNGAGKSTLFRIIAGIEAPTSGAVTFHKADIQFSFLFQQFQQSLLLWKTVEDNIILPLLWKGAKKAFCLGRLLDLIEELHLDIVRDRLKEYPTHLSGGEAQTIALLRSLIVEPDVLLLDEPTSALDLVHRLKFMEIIKKFRLERQVTILSIFHDLDSALSLSDKVILMSSKPSTILEIFELGNSLERSVNFYSTDIYIDSKKRIINALT